MRKQVLKLVFLILFIFCAFEAMAQTRDADYDKGYEAYLNGDYKAALGFYNRSIAGRTAAYMSYLGRAQCYYAMKDYDKAYSDYETAIQMDPDNATAYSARGMAVMADDPDLSLSDLSTVIRLQPSNKYAYWIRANCFRFRREFRKALADVDRSLLLDSNQINVYGTRAMINIDLGRYEKAVEDIKTIQRKDIQKGYGYYLVNVFEPLARMHRFNEALGYYSILGNAVLSRVDDESYRYYVLDIQPVLKYLNDNDYVMAAETLTELQKAYSSDTSQTTMFQRKSYSFLLSLKGFALENLGKGQEAKEIYKQAIILNEAQPEVLEGLARLEEKSKAVVAMNDTEDPQIQILEPAKSRSISIEDDNPASSNQRIRGQVRDAGGVRSVKVNNVAVKVEENGYFETLVALKPGKNIFSVVASDNAANVSSVNVEVELGKSNGAAPPPPTTAAPVFDNTPVFHAILIAESQYTDRNIPSLPGPIRDMEKIYELLVNNYTFDPARVTRLTNASRTHILETIAKVSGTLMPNESLFIFYAGHGQMVKRPDGKEDGFLVPSDAIKDALSTYIRGDALFQTLEYSKAKHILVVADACFAGSLFRDIGTEAEISVQEAYKDQSRKVLASGNRTIVPDESKFIAYLRTSLLNNKKKYVTAEQIVNGFKDAYINETRLNLQYYPIAGVDLGGQFVFIRK